MKKLRLIRNGYPKHCTQGILRDEESKQIIMVTLELPWVNNSRSVSCIPSGVYSVKKYSSTKYKDAFHITGVQDRSYILIHAGNTYKHTQGCVLVGTSFGELRGIPAVLGSQAALNRLRKYVGDDDFSLIVCNWCF